MIRRLREGGRGTQLLLAAVFACALLLRLAIPDGWMPAQTAHGWRLTICTGMGPLDSMPAMTMDHGVHRMPAGDHHKTASSICPFSGLGMAMVDPFVPPFAFVPPIFAAVSTPLHDVVAIGRGLAAPPPPQTGPPVIA
jgi:hypothetical protein